MGKAPWKTAPWKTAPEICIFPLAPWKTAASKEATSPNVKNSTPSDSWLCWNWQPPFWPRACQFSYTNTWLLRGTVAASLVFKQHNILQINIKTYHTTIKSIYQYARIYQQINKIISISSKPLEQSSFEICSNLFKGPCMSVWSIAILNSWHLTLLTPRHHVEAWGALMQPTLLWQEGSVARGETTTANGLLEIYENVLVMLHLR